MHERPKEANRGKRAEGAFAWTAGPHFDLCARFTSVANVTLSSSDSNARWQSRYALEMAA
jgi:hypothetical protein